MRFFASAVLTVTSIVSGSFFLSWLVVGLTIESSEWTSLTFNTGAALFFTSLLSGFFAYRINKTF